MNLYPGHLDHASLKKLRDPKRPLQPLVLPGDTVSPQELISFNPILKGLHRLRNLYKHHKMLI